MEYLIIICQSIVIAAGMTLAIMGIAASIMAFFPNLEDDEACKYEPQDMEEPNE